MIGSNDTNACLKYLLEKTEADRQAFARLLHDEVGGLLVAASMDIAWAEEHFTGLDDESRARLRRIREGVRNAIAIKRRIVEDLRPTLLDNVGLTAALQWHFKTICSRSGLGCSGEYPEAEPRLTNGQSIGIFRIAEDSLNLLAAQKGTRSLRLKVSLEEPHLVMDISSLTDICRSEEIDLRDSALFACVAERVRALGGDAAIEPLAEGGSRLSVHVPQEPLTKQSHSSIAAQ
jgi:signal transduction histidine kinase